MEGHPSICLNTYSALWYNLWIWYGYNSITSRIVVEKRLEGGSRGLRAIKWNEVSLHLWLAILTNSTQRAAVHLPKPPYHRTMLTDEVGLVDDVDDDYKTVKQIVARTSIVQLILRFDVNAVRYLGELQKENPLSIRERKINPNYKTLAFYFLRASKNHAGIPNCLTYFWRPVETV